LLLGPFEGAARKAVVEAACAWMGCEHADRHQGLLAREGLPADADRVEHEGEIGGYHQTRKKCLHGLNRACADALHAEVLRVSDERPAVEFAPYVHIIQAVASERREERVVGAAFVSTA